MNPKDLFAALFILTTHLTVAQLKVGSNPSRIDPSSLIELENSNKALVLTRVTNK